jgi:hypothetical protein
MVLDERAGLRPHRLERRRILEAQLHVRDLRLVDRVPDPAEEPAVRFRHAGHVGDEGMCDPVRGDVVQLADVRDRVLAGDRLDAANPGSVV